MKTTRFTWLLSVVFTVLLLVPTEKLMGQNADSSDEYQFNFRGEAMAEVLDHIARTTRIDLVYDPELIRNIHVYKRLRGSHVPDLLTELLKDYRLDYITLSSGTIVIVRSPRESPSYGGFAGIIMDETTGEPLPGASVMLADASGGTSSNRSGHFSLNRMISGTHHIIISYLGYESVYKTINIMPNQEIQEEIGMKPRAVDFSPLVVEAHRTQLPAGNSGNILIPAHENEQAGAGFRPIRNLSLMPGVQYGLPMTDLHLQGSPEGDHRILLDGVPVYNPHSFGRMFSSFSPFAIGKVRLHKAGYGVQEGSQMAGLIDISHELNKNGNRGFLIQSDPLSLNMKGQYSKEFSGSRKLHLMAAGRSSFWNFYSNPVLDDMLASWNRVDPLLTNLQLNLEGDAVFFVPHLHDSEINFSDLHVAAAYEPDRFSSIEASVYAGDNSVITRVLNQNTGTLDSERFLYAGESYYWSNMLARVQYNRMITPRLDISIRTAYSENQFDHTSVAGLSNTSPFRSFGSFRVLSADSPSEVLQTGFTLPSKFDANRIRHLFSAADITWSFTPSFYVETGLRTDFVHSRVSISDVSYLGANTSQNSGIYSSYLNLNHNFSRFWRVSYGTRLTMISNKQGPFIEPRASIQFDRPDSGIGYWSLRFAGGLYRQFINEYRITNTGITSIVPETSLWSHADESAIPKAYHLSGSLLLQPNDDTAITLESFYKWQPVTNITSYRNLTTGTELERSETEAFATNTSLSALGAGIRIHQNINGLNVRLISGYDYSFSQIDFSEQFDRKIITPWNEPHRAQFRTIWRAFPNFSMALKWQGVWGRAWGFKQAYYNYLRFTDSIIVENDLFENPENDRLPFFSQADLSLIWQPSPGKSDMEIRLDLINLLNRKNVTEFYLTPIYGRGIRTGYKLSERTLPGFYPNISFTVSF